jgi:hypothetical protein
MEHSLEYSKPPTCPVWRQMLCSANINPRMAGGREFVAQDAIRVNPWRGPFPIGSGKRKALFGKPSGRKQLYSERKPAVRRNGFLPGAQLKMLDKSPSFVREARKNRKEIRLTSEIGLPRPPFLDTPVMAGIRFCPQAKVSGPDLGKPVESEDNRNG